VPDDPYLYPGTNTLRNRYGIRDRGELAHLEADLSARRLAVLEHRRLAGAYDLAHPQAFHREIFGDVYEWAGEIRTVAIAKRDVFAVPEHIEPYRSNVLRQLSAEDHLRGLGREPALDRLTYYLSEINATHPFGEGNGRTHVQHLPRRGPRLVTKQQLAADLNLRSVPRWLRRGLPSRPSR
jgi:cell filamentation protein